MKLHQVFAIISFLFLFSTQSKAQLLPTNLEITILDELGNIQPGALVRIYEKETDYDEKKNMLMQGKTDSKGRVKFKKLKTQPYFIHAERGDLDNIGGGYKTGALTEKKTNKVNIIISGVDANIN